jgi:tRNA(Ile)-lysidine synthase TilS/MesJ
MELIGYQKVFEDYVSEYNLLPKNSQVFALVSGGKDSTAMSYLFKKYANKRKDLKIECLNVVFPQMVFGKSKKEINDTVKKISKGLKKFTSRIAETSYNQLELTKNPCLLCKQVRRNIIAEIIAKEKKKNIIIATAHNNYDLLAYFAEFFSISNKELAEKGISYEQLHKISLKDEQLEHFSHFFPKLELDFGITLMHPMLRFSRLEIEDMFCRMFNLKKPVFTTGCGIAGFLEPCSYAKERPKRVLFKFLSALPEGQIKNLTNHNTLNEMLTVLKDKVENYDEALGKIKKTNYEELLF